MKDPRISTLAHNLVNYSVCAKPGEKVLLEATEASHELVTELIKKIYEAGAFPFVEIFDKRIDRAVLLGMTEEHAKSMAKYALARMDDMDCYIGIRGLRNSFETSDVPSDRMAIYSKNYSYPVHHESRVGKTKWVVLIYPTDAAAQNAGVPTEKFEDFYFNVCNLDYGKMDRAMDALKTLMDKTDKVRLIAKDTDLTFSIKGIGSMKCAGKLNIPDGEIYSAPVKNSVNGVITYNVPSVKDSYKFENVQLTFKDGKIIKVGGNNIEKLEAIFNTDEGARYVGEFAIGVNPFITKPICDTLFDEKITGSIHFTPGSCYDDVSNGNQSAIHWDLVLVMTPEYGGGEIWFDDVLICKDGRFILPELDGLNPDKLV